MANFKKKDRLGMGLSGLFGEKNQNLNLALQNLNNSENSESSENASENINQEEINNNQDHSSIRLFKVDIKLIKPCKDQPRKHFDMNALKELSESIQKNGVLQPILLKEVDEDGYYEIIAGERRWRASLMAGLDQIPAIIKKYENEDDVFVVSVIENLQRSDLLATEEMDAYIKLSEKGYTHEQIGNLVGKSRSYITNILRLEDLPFSIKEMMNEGKISIGHAKALIQSSNPEELASLIVAKDLNVRQTEELVRKINKNQINLHDQNSKSLSSKKNKDYFHEEEKCSRKKDQETIELENLISSSINSEVLIENDHIKIHYRNFEDLDRLINLLIGEKV